LYSLQSIGEKIVYNQYRRDLQTDIRMLCQYKGVKIVEGHMMSCWSEGYYVSTIGLNEATTKKYIRNQEKHDQAVDKLSVREYEALFYNTVFVIRINSV